MNYYTYVYRITHVINNKHYYGVRFAINKYSDNPLEDLKQYQSSSTDKDFKEELRQFPERFKFKIVKVFETNSEYSLEGNFDTNGCIIKQACLLERRLHVKFQVDVNESFYNRSIARGFMEGSEWDGEMIYDLEKDCEYTIENAREFNKEFGSIKSLVVSNILSGRFCKIDENLEKNKERYIKENTLLIWCKVINNQLITKQVLYKDCNKEIGIRFIPVLNGNINSTNGWFVDKELCLQTYKIENTPYTFYKMIDGCVVEKTLLYKECRKEIGVRFTSLLNQNKQSTNGWFLDKDLCIQTHRIENTLHTFYKIIEDKLVERTLLHKECNREIGKHFIQVLNQSLNSTNGWFLDKDLCIQTHRIENTLHTFYKIIDNQLITKQVLYKDCMKEIGIRFTYLLNQNKHKTYKWMVCRQRIVYRNILKLKVSLRTSVV